MLRCIGAFLAIIRATVAWAEDDVCALGKELDWLLCDDKCKAGTFGIEPVFWTQCDVPYVTGCAAGPA